MEHIPSSLPASPDNTEERSLTFDKEIPWYRPLALWKLYLRFLFSFGLYLLIWSYCLAKDIRNHLDPKIRPWHYPLILLLPFGMVFVGVRQAKQLRLIGMGNTQTKLTNPWLIGILLFFMTIFTFVSNKIDEDAIWIMLLLMLPIPWLPLQYQVNLIKNSLIQPNWILPTRFSRVMNKLGIVAGVIILMLIGILIYTELPRFSGEPLLLGQTVENSNNLYSIRIPGTGWKKAELGTLAEGTDLEIYGPTTDTWALSYVHTNRTLDEAVYARRAAMQDDTEDITFTEHREFLKTSLFPVSHLVFTAKDPLLGNELYWWVSTVETENQTIELIVHTSEELKIQVQSEMLAKSLSLPNRK